jgi:phosphohistidine phosphatase
LGSIYDQSAVIPFQIKNKEIRILLITSLKSRTWIFPKGFIEDELSAQQSAEKEAYEEAGIEGQVLDLLLGEYKYNKWGGTCHVKVFPMHVTKIFDEWPEDDLRKRKWMPLKNAGDIVEKSELQMLLKKFKKNIKVIISLITDYS